MPKQRGALRLTGKDAKNNKQYAETKGGFVVKELAPKGSHKNEPALKKNYNATAGVNKLASQVNDVLKFYASGFLESRRIDVLRSFFFNDLHAHRLWRLKRLEGMEGHTRNKLSALMNPPAIELIVNKDKIIIPFSISQHPETKRGEHYFHYLRIVLMQWNGKDNSCTHQSRRTNSVAVNAELPLDYEFKFEKKKDSAEWLVMLCLGRGEEEADDRMPPDKNIMIYRTGSFDKKAEAEYNLWLHEQKTKVEKPMKKTAVNDVVMPKKREEPKVKKEDVVAPKKRGEVKKKVVRKKAAAPKKAVKKKTISKKRS